MSYPTGNLVARYEPKDWGYADGDVITAVTKKFLDGTSNHNDLTTVVGTPTYKTNILNGLACVRFSGTAQACSGLFSTGHDTGTIAAVVVPRGAFGANLAYWSYNNAGSNNTDMIYHDGTHLAGFWNGSVTSSNAIVHVIGQPDVLWLDYNNNSTSNTNHLRVNMWPAGSRAGLASPGFTPTQFSVAFNGFTGYVQIDVFALFIYSAQQTGSNQTDLETYLYQTYINLAGGLPTAHLIGQYLPDSEVYSDGQALGPTHPATDQSGAALNLDSTSNAGQIYKTGIYGAHAVYREAAVVTDIGLSSTAGGHAVSSRQHTIATKLIPRGSIAAGNNWCLAHSNGSGGYGGGIVLTGTGPAWQISEYDGATKSANGGTPAVGTADQVVIIGADNSTCLLRVNGSQVGTVAVGTLQTSTTQFTIGGNQNTSRAQFDTVVCVLYDTAVGGQWLTDIETYLSTFTSSVAYTLTVNTTAFTLVDNNVTLTYGPHVGPPGVRGAPRVAPVAVPTRTQRYYHILDDE